MKQQINFRSSELTAKQLAALVNTTGMNQTEVIAIAIDRMYREENVKHQLSVNNGRTDCTPAEAIEKVGFDTLVNAMDDTIREEIHNGGELSHEEFIAAYIERDDLIVG